MLSKTYTELRAELATLESKHNGEGNAPVEPDITNHDTQPTADFIHYALGPTWRQRNTGLPFDEWVKANGLRLAKLHDQRSLGRIRGWQAILEQPVTDVHGQLKHLEAKLEMSIAISRLSNRYSVDKPDRHNADSFFTIEEE